MAKILVVDDDPAILGLIQQILEKHDYDIVSAASVRVALKMLDNDPAIDLVLSDVHMPKASAFDLLRAVAQTPRLHSLPIILLSAKGDEPTLREGLKAGAKDFIVKPFTADTLTSKIERILRQGKPCVLLIEDEKLIRDKLRHTIERQGFTVLTEKSAEDGLARLNSDRVEIVIADIGLPGMNGMELTRLVKERYPGIAVVIITGLSASQTKGTTIRCGADAYLSKPFRNTEIILKLRGVLQNQAAGTTNQ